MLDQIVSYKRSQLDAIDKTAGIKAMETLISNLPPTISLREKIQAEPDISIIAEIKRQSPSRGILNNHVEIAELAKSYESAGAAAISVLTEDKFFRGCPDDLITARSNTSLPILRKDFIIDEYQVWESRVIGADAILLIVRVLSSAELSQLSRLAQTLDLDVVIEVHDRSELDIALSLCPRIIGINNRNLATFETDLTTFESLAAAIPADTLTISESGVFSRDDILFLKERGADAVLVGESIISSPDPYLKIRELRGTNPMTRIKICGITNVEDAMKAAELGAHAVGFIFSEGPRRIDPKTAKGISLALPPFISKVGVFVNEETEVIERLVRECRLDAIQLHRSGQS